MKYHYQCHHKAIALLNIPRKQFRTQQAETSVRIFYVKVDIWNEQKPKLNTSNDDGQQYIREIYNWLPILKAG